MEKKENFAIISSGGKQYKAVVGKQLVVEKLVAEPGSELTLKDVLVLGNDEGIQSFGSPLISGASVTARVIGDKKDKKVITFKKKRRHGYTKKQGHRQTHTVLAIESISK